MEFYRYRAWISRYIHIDMESTYPGMFIDTESVYPGMYRHIELTFRNVKVRRVDIQEGLDTENGYPVLCTYMESVHLGMYV